MLLFYGEMFTLVKHTVHSVCVCGYSCFYCFRQRSLHYGFLDCAHNVKWVHTLQAGIYVVRYKEWISTLSYVPLMSFLFIHFNIILLPLFQLVLLSRYFSTFLSNICLQLCSKHSLFFVSGHYIILFFFKLFCPNITLYHLSNYAWSSFVKQLKNCPIKCMHLQTINTLQKGTCDGRDTVKYLTTMCDEILPASADGNQSLKRTKALFVKT